MKLHYGTVLVLSAAAALAGCGKKESAKDQRWEDTAQKVQARWGKSLDQLPTVKLVVISPNNTDIEKAFSDAFSRHQAVEKGQKVQMEFRDVGGGGSAILTYLRNMYQNTDNVGIDIIWGGGDYVFNKLAEENILQPMSLSEDILANIPATLGGLNMYNPDRLWCGSAISGFGILYNVPLLKRLNCPLPETWDDLGKAEYFDLIGLADPTQSASAVAAYEMIVQSGKDWPTGWAKLLNVLANAKRFYDSAGGAADAPVNGEAAISTCVDFYGATRVDKYPKDLVYVSPAGQTAFNPDPIAIAKNPPNPELAQDFVNFVLSPEGQVLWALPASDPEGPSSAALGRQPIRKDVYALYGSRFSPWIINPYEAGKVMVLDIELWDDSFSVLRQLIWAAAINNVEPLKAAKKKLIQSGFDPQLLEEFNRLPENVNSREKLHAMNDQLKDAKLADQIISDWIRFYRDKYQRILR